MLVVGCDYTHVHNVLSQIVVSLKDLKSSPIDRTYSSLLLVILISKVLFDTIVCYINLYYTHLLRAGGWMSNESNQGCF